MSTSSMALSLFTVLNAARLVGYIPQIGRIARDNGGAEAVSITTWAMLSVSNVSTVIYAACNHDVLMSVMFAGNASCSLIVTVLATCKRLGLARRRPSTPV